MGTEQRNHGDADATTNTLLSAWNSRHIDSPFTAKGDDRGTACQRQAHRSVR
jgi:hypothetical protein